MRCLALTLPWGAAHVLPVLFPLAGMQSVSLLKARSTYTGAEFCHLLTRCSLILQDKHQSSGR